MCCPDSPAHQQKLKPGKSSLCPDPTHTNADKCYRLPGLLCPLLYCSPLGAAAYQFPKFPTGLLLGLDLICAIRSRDLTYLLSITVPACAGGCFSHKPTILLLATDPMSGGYLSGEFCGSAWFSLSPPPTLCVNQQVLQSHRGKPKIPLQNLTTDPVISYSSVCCGLTSCGNTSC